VDFNALLLGQKCGGGLRGISGYLKEGDSLALDILVSLSSMYSLTIVWIYVARLEKADSKWR
jgi:hypothetical protein